MVLARRTHPIQVACSVHLNQQQGLVHLEEGHRPLEAALVGWGVPQLGLRLALVSSGHRIQVVPTHSGAGCLEMRSLLPILLVQQHVSSLNFP